MNSMQIAELYDTVKTIRRQLHQIPEIGFDLPLTSEYVRQKLMAFGYEPISTAETGWVAVLEGKSPAAVAFRADMDALEVTEETGADFASLHPGKMHACGHDGHMALLLGFAKYLKSLPMLEKSLVLVFQPAEEGPGGAKWIMDSGILQELQVEKIYGYHLYPSLPEGILGLAKGPLMARNGEFDITLEGVSSHAGQPHFGKDALIAAAQILLSVQNILARDLDPLQPAVVNIGTLHAGEARNIVAGKAELTGTIRSYDKAVYASIKERLADICAGIERLSGVICTLDIRDFYPEVTNDADMIGTLMDALPVDAYEVVKPLMLAEDFAFYQESIRGAFILLGTGRPDMGWTHPLHSSRFNFDEKVLLKGIACYDLILEKEGLKG